MYDLKKIDLGNDEAEQDQRLQEYFVKTRNYDNALSGRKTLVIGRKGSGKPAIFRLTQSDLPRSGAIVIPMTLNQYSWSSLRDYKEQSILPLQAHANAWKMTLLSAVVWKLNELKLIESHSNLRKYYQYLRDSYVIEHDNWFLNIVEKAKSALKSVKTPWGGIDSRDVSSVSIPLRVTKEMKAILKTDIPTINRVRILIDRLDDSWDGSK